MLYVVTYAERKFPRVYTKNNDAVLNMERDSAVLRTENYQEAKRIQNRYWNKMKRHKEEIDILRFKDITNIATIAERDRLVSLLNCSVEGNDDKNQKAINEYFRGTSGEA